MTAITSTTAENVRSLRAYWLVFIFVSVVTCLPIWLIRYPPLADYPNHLARVYIFHHYNDVEIYQSRYDRIIEPIPNLAMDLIVPPLLYLFDVNTAGKVFLTITVLLFSIGCHLLGSVVHGRPTWTAVVCLFFSYNSLFIYGFVNYIFSLALFFITLASWLKYREKWKIETALLVSLLVFASYLAHLSAYTFLGVTLVTITFLQFVQTRRISRDMIVGLLPLLPPMLAFVSFMKGSGRTGQIDWGDLGGKLRASISWILTYNFRIDIALMLIMLASLGVVVRYSRNQRIEWIVFTAGVVLGVLFIVCPQTLLTSWGADRRFLPPAVILMALALRFEVTTRVRKSALFLVIVVLLLRLGLISYEWNKYDKEIASQVAMFSHFEDSARVYPIVVQPRDPAENRVRRAFSHTIHYSTINQHTYTPTLFAIPGQQLLLLRDMPSHTDGYEDYTSAGQIDWRVSPDRIDWTLPDLTPDKVDWEFVFSNHDYIWCYNINDDFARYLKERCTVVVSAKDSIIFRINKRDAATALP